MDAKKNSKHKVRVSRTPPGRPRDDEARTAILEAALALVREAGYRPLSIGQIAIRSGSAKTTVYRWWPSKAAVVMEAFLVYISPLIEFSPVSQKVSAIESISKQMKAVVRAFDGPYGELLRSLMGEAQLDKELQRSFVEDWIAPRRARATAILKAGIKSGELKDTLNTDLTIDALYGGLYYRLLMPYAPLTAKFAQQLVDLVLKPQSYTRHHESKTRRMSVI